MDFGGLLIGYAAGSARANQPLGAANADAGVARAARADARVTDLEDRVDRLLLVCSALWSLLRETTGLTEEQLQARVKEIDLSDGRLDGRTAPMPPATCGSCGRVFAPRHARCIWCGAERTSGRAFDAAR